MTVYLCKLTQYIEDGILGVFTTKENAVKAWREHYKIPDGVLMHFDETLLLEFDLDVAE